MSIVLYCIVPSAGRTNASYVGITADLKHRLRQHNGEITGGARATRGKQWEPLYVVSGLPDRRTAAQLEWRLHRRVGRRRGETAAAKRIRQLQRALQMERVTAEAPATSSLALTITWRAGTLPGSHWPENVTML